MSQPVLGGLDLDQLGWFTNRSIHSMHEPSWIEFLTPSNSACFARDAMTSYSLILVCNFQEGEATSDFLPGAWVLPPSTCGVSIRNHCSIIWESWINIFMFICFVASFVHRVTANQGFYILGLYYASPSFASAMQNSVPAITFLLASVLRWL